MSSIHWTDETKAFVAELYNAPGICSYSDMARLINDKFQTNYTRAAVLGVSRRMGLKGKPSAPSNKKTSSARVHLVGRIRIVRAAGNTDNLRIIQTFQPETISPVRCAEVDPRMVSLIDLEKNECRYPYGENTILFCGHPIQPDSSYCPAHRALCYVKPEHRSRSMAVAA